MSANSTTCANDRFSRSFQSFTRSSEHQNEPVLTSVLTQTKKRSGKKRFQRVCYGLYRFNRTGTLYAVFKVGGRTRWKSLSTDNVAQAKLLLAEEIKNVAQTDWKQAATLTIGTLVEMHTKNPMGLAASTLKIRVQLLDVFKRTWPYGFGMKASEVKPIMLKSWLAERKQQQALKAAGLNNYVRTLHGLFQIAVGAGAVVESPAKQLKLSKEESPDRLTPTWEQANSIISVTKRQISRDMLSAMLLLGLGQAELENLHGEHFDFERGQITVRRQKTQKVFIIPMYPQARSLLEGFKTQGRIIAGQPSSCCPWAART